MLLIKNNYFRKNTLFSKLSGTIMIICSDLTKRAPAFDI